MKLVVDRLGITFKLIPASPWSAVLAKAEKKELDVLSIAQTTPARRNFLLFTKPYLSQGIVIVTRDNVGYVEDLSALAGKTVSYQKDSQTINQIMVRYPEIKQSLYKENLDALNAVANGKVFAYVGNLATVSYWMRKEGLTNIKVAVQLKQRVDLSVAVRDDWPLLRSAIQKALDSITQEEKNAIFKKWIGVKVDAGISYWKIAQYLAVFAMVLVVFLVWNLTLKRKIREVSDQLQHQSNYDSLTDFPNRFLVNDRLNQLIKEARRENEYVAVLTIGLDNLNKINSSLGFSVGDQFIIEFAKRIQQTLRFGDTAGRFDGDTFVVLIGGLKDPTEVDWTAEALMMQFRRPYEIKGRELNVTASVGVAFYPADGEAAQTVFRYSGAAMQYAKKNGKNNLSYYNRTMNEKINRKLQLDQAMIGALERGEFQPHFQPKLDIKSGEISGFEVLLRWFHPKMESIPPDEFIPVAEENGMILQIGEFVIKEALKMVVKWQQELNKPLSIAVNISPVQFKDPDLLHKVESLLRLYGVQPGMLEFEITEGVLIQESEAIQTTLEAFEKLGLKISMDDFGKGYSSLSYLRKYPFDIIKIDREFILDLEEVDSSKELIIATIAMAHSLGLQVVAEGVETIGQLEFLAEHGCDIAQGFLFSPPVAPEEVPGLFK